MHPKIAYLALCLMWNVFVGLVMSLAEVSVPIVMSQKDSSKHTCLCNGRCHAEIPSKHDVSATEEADKRK